MAFTPEMIEHFERPRHAGDLPEANVRVRVENPVCGDVLELAARVVTGRVEEVRFKAKGCVAAMAAGSAIADRIAGAQLAALRSVRPEDVSAALGGLPAESRHAGQLAADALRRLIDAAEGR